MLELQPPRGPSKAQSVLWATALPHPEDVNPSLLPEPVLELLSPPSDSKAHLPSTVLLPPTEPLSGPHSPPRRIRDTHRPIPLPAGHPVGPPAHPPRHPSLSRPQSHQERPTPQQPPWGSSRPIFCQDCLEGTLWPRLLPPETDDSHPGQTGASGARSPRAQTHTDRKGQVRVRVRPLPLRTVRPWTSCLSL